jgi:hypothetical protein
MTRIAIVAVFGIGCTKNAGPDECQRYVERAEKVTLEAMGDGSAKPYQIDGQAKICRDQVSRGHRPPALDCVLAAKDDATIRACLGLNVAAIANDMVTWKTDQAKQHLLAIAEGAKAAHARTASFPVGDAPPTPPTSCCAPPDYKCVWPRTAPPIWDALSFKIEKDFYFHYSYRSDGTTFTATATGDPACDGKNVTFEIHGELRAGVPHITTGSP